MIRLGPAPTEKCLSLTPNGHVRYQEITVARPIIVELPLGVVLSRLAVTEFIFMNVSNHFLK